MIFTGFSPNLTGRDALKALGYLVLLWKWGNMACGKNACKVEKRMEKYFRVKHTLTFDSGRTALYYALKALDVSEGDEVLVQAYTCVVVANSIVWTGAKPVYVDIGDDFNMDTSDLEKKITTKAKAIIVQHTYGIPADLNGIREIAKKHGLKIIEDCAHSFGAKYNGKLTGTIGDIGMFSFGSDKILSCVRGGALITNDASAGAKLKEYQDGLKPLARKFIVQHLAHYPIFYLGKLLYGIWIGKIILGISKKLGLMNKIITKNEKVGKRDELFACALPNALADILLNQLDEVEQVNARRREIAKLYGDEISAKALKPLGDSEIGNDAVVLRYPILVNDQIGLMKYAKRHKILLGDWYDSVIAPRDIRMENTGYNLGSCPRAESLAKKIVNLPVGRHIGKREAKKVIKAINNFLDK